MKNIVRLLLAAMLFIPNVKLWAQCDDNETSCTVSILCSDAIGDGWNGAAIKVYQSGVLRGTASPTQGYEATVEIMVCAGDTMQFVWQSGPLDGEIFFSILNGDGTVIVSEAEGYSLTNGQTIAYAMPSCPSCVAPMNLTCQHDSASATVGWMQLNNESTWLVTLNGGTPVMTNSNPYTFSNLTINTDYVASVRTLCSNGDTSAAAYITFRTGCGPLVLPYFNNFDSETSEELPACWNSVLTYGNLPKVFDDYAYSGSLSLFFGATHDYNFACTPAIPVPGDEIAVNFMGYIEQGLIIMGIPLISSHLEAGVMSDPSDTSTFIALISVDTMDNQWHPYEFNTSSLNASEQYHVAFRFYGDDIFWGNASVDDLSITHYNGCNRPFLTYVESVGSHSALLSWDNAGNNASGYDLYVSEVNNPQTSTYYGSTQDTFMLVTGLSQNTAYYMWVRTACGDVNADYKAFPFFVTPLTCAPVANVQLASVNHTAAALEWQYDYFNGYTPNGALVKLYDLNDTTFYAEEQTDGNSVLFTGLNAAHLYRAYIYTTCQMEDAADTANGVAFEFMTEACNQVVSEGLAGAAYVVNTNYSSSYLQMLYTTGELNGLDTIYGLAFQTATEVVDPLTFNVYLYNSQLNSLGQTSYVPFDSLVLVKADYTLQAGSAGWKIIQLDSPFVYDTASNLIVATFHNSNLFYLNPIEWGYHSTNEIRTYGWNNLGYLNPTAPPSYFDQSLYGVPNIRFLSNCDFTGCEAPLIFASDADANSITVSWVGTEDNEFYVQYKPLSQADYTDAGSTFDTVITLSGLNASTTYTVRVGNICYGDTLWDYKNIQTECGTVTIPYSENFDAYANYVMPPCWKYNSALAGHLFGGLMFSTNNSVSAAQRAAILPMTETDLASLEINFRAKLGPQSEGYAILIGVANDDGYNIEWVDTLSDAFQSKTNFIWFSHSFEEYNGTNTRIALSYITQVDDYDYYGALIDDISITALSSCPVPTGLTAINTADASAITVAWSDPGGVSQFEIRWDTLGTAPSQMSNTQTTLDTFYSLPALVSGGKYSFYVRSLCSDENSAWRSIDFAAGGIIMEVNQNDTVVGCGFVIYDDGGLANNYSNNSTSMLIVHPQDTNSVVTFTGGSIDLCPWGGDALYVYEGEGTSGQLLFSCTYTFGTENYTTNIASETGALTFLFLSDNNNSAMGYELFTGCAPKPTCPRPKNLNINTISSTSVYVTWTGSASHYDIYYRPVNTSTWQLANSSTNSVALTGLLEGTGYELYVVGICSGNDESPNSVTVTFTTPCTATEIAADTPLNEDFESPQVPATCFTIFNAGNTSNEMVHATDHPYSGNRSFRFSSFFTSNDYNQYLISPQLEANDSISLRFRYCDAMYGQEKMRIGYSTTNNNITDFVWVDTITTQGVTWKLYQRDFPQTTKYVAINYFSDYRYYAYIDSLRISLVASADCPTPQITNINESAESISIEFETAGTPEVYITDQAWNDNVSGIVTTGNNHTFTGLTPNTSYTIGVRSNCGNGMTSAWTTQTVITAIQGCEPPSAFTLDDVDYTSATFSWETSSGDEWEINLYNTAFNHSYTASASPFTVTGLAQDVNYSAKIRSICNGMPGDWSNLTLNFTTPICQPASNVQWTLTDQIDGTASIHVTWEGAADRYEIEYGEEHFPVAGGTTITNIQSTECTISGLEYGISYDLYVRAICGEGIYSNWSSRLNFMPTTEGIDIADNEVALTIYPNPATQHTLLELTGIEGAVNVELIDLNGRTLQSSTLHCNGDCRKRYDLGQMKAGIYFVRVSNSTLNLVRKLIIK